MYAVLLREAVRGCTGSLRLGLLVFLKKVDDLIRENEGDWNWELFVNVFNLILLSDILTIMH